MRVTILAPEALTASAVSVKLLYFPVPTINLEEIDLPAILSISFFILAPANKMYNF